MNIKETYNWCVKNKNLIRKIIYKYDKNLENLDDNYNEIILNLSNDINLLERWNKYRKEHTYAKEVEFEDTIKAIEKIHKIL